MKITREGESVVVEATRLPLSLRFSLRVFANEPEHVRIRQDGHSPDFMTLETAHEMACVWREAAQAGQRMLGASHE